VSKAIEGGGRWMFDNGRHRKNACVITASVAPHSAEDTLAVFPREMKIAARTRAERTQRNR
jgi:hypothetical protein